MTGRYEGKPFLKLVDSYILDAIGHLDAQSADALTAMEPQLRETYGSAGSWQQIVAAQMRFPEGMPGALREMWEKGRPRFVAANGHEPDPVAFVQTFVDTKFPH